MTPLLAVADAIVHAAMAAILLGATGFTALLLAEQVHLIRTSLTTTKEHHHDRPDA